VSVRQGQRFRYSVTENLQDEGGDAWILDIEYFSSDSDDMAYSDKEGDHGDQCTFTGMLINPNSRSARLRMFGTELCNAAVRQAFLDDDFYEDLRFRAVWEFDEWQSRLCAMLSDFDDEDGDEDYDDHHDDDGTSSHLTYVVWQKQHRAKQLARNYWYRFQRQRHHRELPRPRRRRKVAAIDRHDFVSNLDVDVLDSEAVAEPSYFELAASTLNMVTLASFYPLTQKAPSSEDNLINGQLPCHCAFSVAASKELIIGACHDMQRSLKRSLNDVLVHRDACKQLVGECELQRQQIHSVIQSQERCSVSGIDAYTGQAMGQQPEHAVPELTALQMTSQQHHFSNERKSLRQAMAKVIKVQQTCHQIHARVRRRYRGGDACRLITSACLTLDPQPCACRISSAASELSSLVCRCVDLRGELRQHLEDYSPCRRSLDECHRMPRVKDIASFL